MNRSQSVPIGPIRHVLRAKLIIKFLIDFNLQGRNYKGLNLVPKKVNFGVFFDKVSIHLVLI